VLRLSREAGIPTYERDFSLTDVYGADEAFVSGTFAGIVPVREVDGRMIGDGDSRPVMHRLRTLYQAAIERDVTEAARR
jgi:branched-chain amino acid aminotransferase